MAETYEKRAVFHADGVLSGLGCPHSLTHHTKGGAGCRCKLCPYGNTIYYISSHFILAFLCRGSHKLIHRKTDLQSLSYTLIIRIRSSSTETVIIIIIIIILKLHIIAFLPLCHTQDLKSPPTGINYNKTAIYNSLGGNFLVLLRYYF